jgi:S1-C subfamily serine protease
MKIVLMVMAVILAATAGGSGYYISSLNGHINHLEDELAFNYSGLDQSLRDTSARLDEADVSLGEALASSNATLNDAIAALGSTLGDYKETTDSKLTQLTIETFFNNNGITSLRGRVDNVESTVDRSVVNYQELYEKVHEATVAISDGTNLRGSGFNIHYTANGYTIGNTIVTAYHVVAGMKEIYMTLHDGTTWQGFFIAGSEEADIALLYFVSPDTEHHPGDQTTLNLADSGSVRAGDPVFVIGSPDDNEDYRLGLRETINTGIISQIKRGGTVGDKYVADLLQFDAAVNFGNSGSALFNARGEVIGVVIGRINPLLGDGIGVAVASNLIQKVAECIDHSVTNWGMPNGYPFFKYKYPWTGITVKDIPPAVMWGVENSITPGAQVTSITGPGIDAGVNTGDIITEIDSRVVHDSDEFYSFLAEYDVGDSVVLTIERSGETLEITVTLGEK